MSALQVFKKSVILLIVFYFFDCGTNVENRLFLMGKTIET